MSGQFGGDRAYIQVATCPRRCTFNFPSALWTCDFVVVRPIFRRRAISLLLRPVRGVSACGPLSAFGGPTELAAIRCNRPAATTPEPPGARH